MKIKATLSQRAIINISFSKQLYGSINSVKLNMCANIIKLYSQTFSFFLGLSLGKESLGRLESDSGKATSDAKHTSLIQDCFTPDAEIRSIFSSYKTKTQCLHLVKHYHKIKYHSIFKEHMNKDLLNYTVKLTIINS